MKIAIGLIVIVLLLLGGAYLYLQQPQFKVDVPAYRQPPEQLIRVDQGWTDAQRLQFHHTPQGTRLLPYEWFMAVDNASHKLGRDIVSD